MQYGFIIPRGDVETILEMTIEAEEAGWDGVFYWDGIYIESAGPMYDPWVTGQLTIRDIVSHRSGLDTFSGDLLWYDTTYPTDEILRRVRYLKPVSDFRTRYGYQNLMFIAAGRVIEKVSGKPWAEFVRERFQQGDVG